MKARHSYVVTGGAQGVGHAIVERLGVDGNHEEVHLLTGDAGRSSDCRRAAELAESFAPLGGWVNNPAVFRDAALTGATLDEVLG